jgi:hypothetical protein
MQNPKFIVSRFLYEVRAQRKRVTISLNKIITRSDGAKATMKEFVKEALLYNPSFHIVTSPKGWT